MKKNIFFESFLYETVSEEPGCRDFGTFFPKKRLGESFESTISTDGSAPYHTFTFTGKEKDSETGYYAFGARYYDCDLSSIFLSVDPMADKYPNISPYAYCAWRPVNVKDPNGMDSINTPNGVASAGKGYRTTPDGMYLYGEGLQTKKWNPYLETGGVVGECGGYEDCDVTELKAYGVALGAATNLSCLDDVVGVGSDGCFKYKRTKYNKLAHGTSANRVKPIGHSIPGKAMKYGGGAFSVLLTTNELRENIQEHGLDSPETYSAIGGAVGTSISLWASTYVGAAAGAAFGGIGAVPGAIAGFLVGVGANIGLDIGGRALGETIYKKTH